MLETVLTVFNPPTDEQDRPRSVEAEISGCYGCLPDNLSPWILTDDVE